MTQKQNLEALYTKEQEDIPIKIAPGEIIVGTLVAFDPEGKPRVDFPQNTTGQALSAVSTSGLTQVNVGRQVALLFANGVLNNPVIVGMIHSPLDEMLDNYVQDQAIELSLGNDENKYKQENTADVAQSAEAIESKARVDDVLIDGKKVLIEAEKEIVFKCGESSITLTESGKILIRGKYLLNRSTGVNRIMGGSVQVN